MACRTQVFKVTFATARAVLLDSQLLWFSKLSPILSKELRSHDSDPEVKESKVGVQGEQ